MHERRRTPPPAEVSRRLYEAWRHGPSVEQAKVLIDEIPVPGSVALRGRFMLLTDPQGTYPRQAFNLGWDAWKRQIELTEAADRSLVGHDRGAVEAAVDELIASHHMGLHPLPIVDALVARGDAARQDDEAETAVVLLDEARTTAAASGYRFGYMRATLSLAYVTVQKGSADESLLLFAEAERIAQELDDRVFRAGALVGAGEAHHRAGRLDAAIASLAEAVKVFESIGSNGGIVNASLQIGDIYRRQRRNPEARAAFQRAFDLAEEAGPWVATVNALDGLAEIALADGDPQGALGHYSNAHERSLERSYTRGAAHAANGLGRVRYTIGTPERAIEMHVQARDMFAAIGDHLSQSSALTGLADAYEATGDISSAMRARLDAVGQIEVVRAAQERHRPQQEFAERFRAVYRAALETAAIAQDAEAYVAVFEGLSGRRLAGLLGEVTTSTPYLEAQMVAFAQARQDAPEESRAKRMARLLGRTALRAHLPTLVAEGIDDVAASLYTEFDATAAGGIIEQLRDTAVFAPCILPGTTDQVIALHLIPGEEPVIERWTLPVNAVQLLAGLAETGLAVTATLSDVEPLRMLLPPLWESAAGELLIVPLEQLWAVPWPAVKQADGQLLGEAHAITLAPSLTLATSHVADPPRIAAIATWMSPQVAKVNIHAFNDQSAFDLTVVDDAGMAKDLLLHGGIDLLTIVAHGRPAPVIRHFLELDDRTYVTPVDLMSATVPARVALIACWGAHTPGGLGGEPLTLATLAAARGAEVLCTFGELADDVLASRFVNNVLHHAIDLPFPQAVRAATKDYLAEPSRRNGFLSEWAPIVTVGRRRAGSG